jgi:hypothetical protein
MLFTGAYDPPGGLVRANPLQQKITARFARARELRSNNPDTGHAAVPGFSPTLRNSTRLGVRMQFGSLSLSRAYGLARLGKNLAPRRCRILPAKLSGPTAIVTGALAGCAELPKADYRVCVTTGGASARHAAK